MKKLVYGAFILSGLFVAGSTVAWLNLASLVSYAAGRIAGGKVSILKIEPAYRQGILYVDLKDLRMEGKVSGRVGEGKLALNLRKGIHLNHVSISDFDITLKDITTSTKGYSVTPTDLFEASRGVVRYEGETFDVKSVTMEHVRKGKPFQFRMEVTKDNWFGNLAASGVGFLGSPLYFKGKAKVTAMDMSRWAAGVMAGIVDGEGPFVYEKNRFSMDASFRISRYVLTLDELKAPLHVRDLGGRVHLTFRDLATHIHAEDVIYQGAPFIVDVHLEETDVTSVVLSSKEFDVDVMKQYVDPADIGGGGLPIYDYVKKGGVEIKKLAWIEKRPFVMEILLKDMSAAYKDVEIDHINGLFRFDEKTVTLSGVDARFKESELHDVTALFTVADGSIAIRGAYTMSLPDLAPWVNDEGRDFALKGGFASGTASLEGKKGSPFTISGDATVKDGTMVWNGVPLRADGAFTFTRDSITLNPMQIRGSGTDVTVTGTWAGQNMAFHLKGAVDGAYAKKSLPVEVKTDGSAQVDVGIDRAGPVFKAQGTLRLDDVAYEIPRVVKKKKGMANKVAFALSGKASDFHVDRLMYHVDGLDLDLSGRVRDTTFMDLDVIMKVKGFEKAAALFYVKDGTARGDADVNVSLRDVNLKTRKVPFIKGSINVNNGFVKIPWVTKPFREVTLRSVFNGNTVDVRLDRFVCGSSVLKEGNLRVDDLEGSRFALSLAMDNFNLADFQDETAFKVRSVNGATPVARANGRISLRAATMELAGVKGENLEFRGAFADRKMSVSELKLDTMGGSMDMHGTADFSGPVPRFYVSGKIDHITGGRVMDTFFPKSQIIAGTGLFYGSLRAQGEVPADWLKSLSGNMTIYAENGVIRKWNILSKIFGLLNIYDLLRGKVDLTADGLPYTKMGASFLARDGLLRTENFIIDSPSMVITGAGQVDLGKNRIAADVTVSPLVAIDTIIGKVPIVRSILKKKKTGFLYAVYEVKGPLEDPEVTLSFTDTIGGKTLEIIKNILTLPKGVFE